VTFEVLKKVGKKNIHVESFDKIEEAREFVKNIVHKNVVPAIKVGRQWGSVGIWDPLTASQRLLDRPGNGFQKTLYNPVNETKYFVQYSREELNKMNGVTPEVIPFPKSSDVSKQSTISNLEEAA